MKFDIKFFATCAIIFIIIFLTSCTKEKNDYIDRMSAEHENDAPVANEASNHDVTENIVTETVTYATIEGEEVRGYLARPEGVEENLPGVIVIHEWWGLNDNIRMMTRRLADQGYAALAVDLYRGKVAETPDSAGTYARAVGSNPGLAGENLRQAISWLSGNHNTTKTGVIGWCFGGAWSLNTSLAFPDEIDATVIYYGRLVTDPERLQVLDMPILGIFGAEDRGIPVESVREFESVLNDLDKNASIHVYEGADHAFANPSGTRYNPEAAEDAWEKTVAFFGEHLME